MVRKTRRLPRTPEIQHHHLLLRMELERCPGPDDKQEARDLIERVIRDIQMKALAAPHVYYVKVPHYNEGLTAIVPIETSHIAFHFWRTPNHNLLHNRQSRCLLQFDVYTCGTLNLGQVKHILHHLTQYGPCHVNITLLNRNSGLSIERHMKWDSAKNRSSWTQWLESDRFRG